MPETLDLEAHLRELCTASGLDLDERLKRVRRSAEAIWAIQRLAWFTDHRAQTHSRHIIAILGDVLVRLQATRMALSAHELYILLASCYLHDIGMQDFHVEGEARGVDSFTDEDYARIRKLHPQRGKELILKRALRVERNNFRVDLDDDLPYLVPIALVSQGHGTAFFTESIDELRNSAHSPGNAPIRGDLLAALLLMGDELDLHQRRASFPREYSLSPVSLMHHFVHHYVQRVEVMDGVTPKQRRIQLSLEFQEDADAYAPYVLEWIVAKLRRQSEMTNPIIEEATQGELTWDSYIDVSNVATDRYGVRRSFLESQTSQNALHLLKREVIESRTVNREQFTEAMERGLEQCRTAYREIHVLQPDGDHADWPHLAERLTALCDCQNVMLVRVGFKNRIGHDPEDVVLHITGQLTAAAPDWAASEEQRAPHTRANVVEEPEIRLLTALRRWSESRPLVVLLQDLDRAEPVTRKWLEQHVLPILAQEQVLMLLIATRTDRETVPPDAPSRQTFVLSPFTKDQVEKHLQTQFGLSSSKAAGKAGSILAYTSGSPQGVLMGLATERLIATHT